jgi:polysaccharide biosynthesis protein PslJ
MSAEQTARADSANQRAVLPEFPVSTVTPVSRQILLSAFVALSVAGAVAFGLIAVELGLFIGVGLLLAMVAVVAIVSDVRAGLWAAAGVAMLLPFAVVPIRVGLTLTALEAVLLLVYGVWVARLLLFRDEFLPYSTPAALIMLLITVAVFSFLLGVGRGYTAQTFHDYAKFLMALGLVFVIWTTVRTYADHRRLLNVLLIGGSLSAAIGLVFQILGPGFAERTLARLIPLGYPDTRIVRFIEDDPGRSMRLVSTSVDPNSAGGMLAIVFVIAFAQLISRNPLVARWICLFAVPLTGLAMLLTFSRGAWLGAMVGLAVIAVLRYRWLIPVGIGAIASLVVFGIGSAFIERLWLGFTLQDPATVLRLSEYRNAIAIIREYPLFGVGFGDAPSIELQAGVSSIYLTIGQQTGFLGLSAFLLAVVVSGLAGFSWWRTRRRTPNSDSDLMLTLLAVLSAALTIGVFDHYFFNIQFPHMAALFWIPIGMILALARPVRSGTTQEL